MTDTSKKPLNPHLISLADAAADEGYDSADLYLIDIMRRDEGTVAALCDEGCRVEPDGRCSHGCPSPLRAAGLI